MKVSRKRLIAITALAIGATAFGAGIVVVAGVNARVSKASQTGNPSKVSPAVTLSPKPQASTSPAAESTPAASAAPAPTKSPTQTSNTTARPTATPTPLLTPHPQSVLFYAGRIETTYTSCSYGTLSYTLGGVNISVNQATSTPFTWQIELSDGTIFDSDTDVMPSGQTSWYNFPSTPSYPSMIGTISNAEDGDRARLVITKPNYSAGGWSAAVPAGSVDACRNGQM